MKLTLDGTHTASATDLGGGLVVDGVRRAGERSTRDMASVEAFTLAGKHEGRSGDSPHWNKLSEFF